MTGRSTGRPACRPTVSSPSMNSHPPPRRPGLFGRPALTVTLAVAVLAGAGLGGVALADRRSEVAAPVWKTPSAAASGQPAASGKPATPAGEPETESATTGDAITLSAT